MGGRSSALPMVLSENMIVTFARPDHLSLPQLPTCYLPVTIRRALLLEGMRPLAVWVRSCVLSCSLVFDSLWPHRPQPTRFFCPWDFPGKNTRVGCHFLLQGLFLTQESILHLMHCRQILYHWATLWNISDWEYLWTGLAQFKQRAFLHGLCC